MKSATWGEEDYPTPQVNEAFPPSQEVYTPSQEVLHPQSVFTPQERVFEFCRTPRSIVEIANMLGVGDRRWVRKKYVLPFLGTKLKMTILDKPNSQNQKYRTVDNSNE